MEYNIVKEEADINTQSDDSLFMKNTDIKPVILQSDVDVKPVDCNKQHETVIKPVMDAKTNSETNHEVPPKKRKLVRTTIQFKKEIIEKYESGFRVRELSADYNMPRSTISTILKNREVIKAADVAKGVKAISKQRPQILEDVEKLLLVWVNKKQLDGDPISEPMICEKAKQLFADLLKNKTTTSTEETETFKASRGWYENFKKRSGICRHEEAATARKHSAKKFMYSFINFVKEEGLYPQQVFSCHETGLYWKKLPRRTYISQEELALPGHRPMNDKVTLLLCSNASGDLKIRPLLVYHSENPRAFHKTHVDKAELPVMWKSHPKGWITKQIFIDWMNEVFGPTVKMYLIEKNLPLKAVFVLDSGPSHPVDIEDSLRDEFNFISLRFLPCDAAPLLRPIDKSVLFDFKKNYIKVLLERCFSVTSNTELTLREFWKNHFNILHCIQLIDKTWDEVTSYRLNSGWRRLWPEGVFKMEPDVLRSESSKVMEDILTLSQTLNLEMHSDDVEELLIEQKKELTTEELMELLKEQERLITVEISAGVEEEKPEMPVLLVQEVVGKWEEVQKFVEQYHPDKASAERLLGAVNDQIFNYFRGVLSSHDKKMRKC